MLKKTLVVFDNFFYRVLLRNLLKTSKLGYGFTTTGAESGVNFEHIYDNKAQGKYLIGKYVDRILLNLPAVQATRMRKDEVKRVLWNEISNNSIKNRATKIFDIGSGGARYLRELSSECPTGKVESFCIDKDKNCILLGKELSRKQGVEGIRFTKGDAFNLEKLKKFSTKKGWLPNVVIASGFFIYFNNEVVEKMLREIWSFLPPGALIIFSSYEQLNTRKLMRKSMQTSTGEDWTLYYRSPDYWRKTLYDIGFSEVFIFRDQWRMNNICTARK